MNESIYISIDPGANGGISWIINNRVYSSKMPKKDEEIDSFLKRIKENGLPVIVFIEKVQAYIQDDEEPGKKFGINKMLANYNKLIAFIVTNGFQYIEVHPLTWQTNLGLRTKGIKEPKTVRKNKYKEYAQKIFPEIKVTLSNSDSLCIMQFALYKKSTAPKWIDKNIKNKPTENLFT